MSEEVNELMDAFLSLCLEQRQLNNEQEGRGRGGGEGSIRKEELKTSALELAQKLYIKAAELERSGDISKGKFALNSLNTPDFLILAMELYNRAYRLDPDITRHIDHERVAAEISKKDLSELEGYYNPFRKLTTKNDPVDKELVALITESKLNYKTENISFGVGLRITLKSEPNLLEELPETVLERILLNLGWMHLPSLEVASTTSRGMFLACRKESLWRDLSQRKESRAVTPSHFPWRLQFIMQPSFRTDGLYISKITYFRQGYQESAISQPSHLVTYYRYLRLLVMALVSTDKPKSVIELMKEVDVPTLKAIKERIFSKYTSTIRKSKRNLVTYEAKPNLFFGSYWRYPLDDRMHTLLLFDAHSKLPMRLKMKMELGDPGKGVPAHRTAKCLKYSGRVCDEEGGGDTIDFDVHNWGKFYFSRVKSYI